MSNQNNPDTCWIERIIPDWSQKYRSCLVALNRTGLLSILPECERLGIIGLNGQEYPVPTVAEVTDLCNLMIPEQQRLVEEKVRQGFTKLQLTPLGSPLLVICDRVQNAIKKHYDEGKLFQMKHDLDDADHPISIDKEEPLFVRSELLVAQKRGDMIYFPNEYTENHAGMMKGQWLEASKPLEGWRIILIENLAFLPSNGRGIETNGRKQLESGSSPKAYLDFIQHSEQYRGEVGFTLEDELIRFLHHLETTNQISSDWDEASGVWILGNYLSEDDLVVRVHWSCGHGRLHLGGGSPNDFNPGFGMRSAVILSESSNINKHFG
jgi:hypothetical protein